MPSDSASNIPAYQKIQRQFAEYIRDPDSTPVPSGIEPRRMEIYRRLFFNNISSFCARTFKSFRPFLGDVEWSDLIRDFMRKHACTSPYFKDIPLAFLEFLAQSNTEQSGYPFMREMCHLDLIRMQLRLAPDSPVCEQLDLADHKTGLTRASTVRLLSYEWPVHKLTPSTWSAEKPKHPTWLLAFRDQQDQVEVLATNARTFRMLEVLEDSIPLVALEKQLNQEFRVSAEELNRKLKPTIQTLQKRSIVLTVALDV